MAHKTTILIVGAVYKDVILSVQSYPIEDSKVRADSVEYRRGGNGGNTIAVISQYRKLQNRSGEDLEAALEFVGVFAGNREPQDSKWISYHLARIDGVSLGCSVFRGPHFDDATAWIISTQTSRTIVNYTTLNELTATEFKSNVGPVLHDRLSSSDHKGAWLHFEGRNVDEVERMIDHLNEEYRNKYAGKLTVSVEFEKPNRPNLDQLLPKADVCFFSRPYAEGKGYHGAPTGFLDNIRRQCKAGAILLVTWGDKGAYGLINDPHHPPRSFHVPALPIVPMDTIGAGDTFIAGVILGLGMKGLTPEESLEFGVKLASTKCAQLGFDGLAAKVPLPT
ncbi:hypothetical protein HK102_003290 [Quaeritorhiza haematococci]|nr:hypothetical protein HK102_003290 [Quaeritorhiza haematococci]